MELPDELYQCLKNITSQLPSSHILELHLPAIRDTILKLLQGLKLKQKTLRDRFEKTPSPVKETPSPLNLKLPYQKRISVPQTPVSPLTSLSSIDQHESTIDIYLKYDNRTKKLTVTKHELTLEELNRLFYNSFSLNHDNNQTMIIYILDYHTKVEYELENINDIQPYSTLILKGKTKVK